MRFVTGILFVGGAAWVHVENHDPDGSIWMFPMLDRVVGPDYAAQGEATVVLMGAAGVLFLARDLWWYLRDRRQED